MDHPTDAPEASTARETQINKDNKIETCGERSNGSQGDKTLELARNLEIDTSGPESMNSNRSEEELPVFLDTTGPENRNSNRSEEELPVFLGTDQPTTPKKDQDASAEAIAKEQREGAQLKPCFEQVKLCNNKFNENVFFRLDQLVGQELLPYAPLNMSEHSNTMTHRSLHLLVRGTTPKELLPIY